MTPRWRIHRGVNLDVWEIFHKFDEITIAFAYEDNNFILIPNEVIMFKNPYPRNCTYSLNNLKFSLGTSFRP
jgi:hypothetical protein